MGNTVLVADGDSVEAAKLEAALAVAGWEVRRCDDPARALACAREGRLDAMVIADPIAGGSGFKLAELLAEAAPAAARVVLSPRTNGAARERHRAGPRPAAVYLDRPASGESLVAALAYARAHAARSGEPEVEVLHRRLRELELEKLALVRGQERLKAEHQGALKIREEMVRHLELALEALTRDLTEAAHGLARQQETAGHSQVRVRQAEQEMDRISSAAESAIATASELKSELSDLRASLLAAEMEGQQVREQSERVERSLMEARAEVSDLNRALARERARAEEAEAELLRLLRLAASESPARSRGA